MVNTCGYIYLHGFASSSQGVKAGFFQRQLQHLGHELLVPDLNGGDFSTLSMSNMIELAARQVMACTSDKIVVLASSLGAMVAVNLLAEKTISDRVSALFFMAPCFDFMKVLQQQIAQDDFAQWRTRGERQFFHHGEQRNLPLGFHFVEDLRRYDSYARQVVQPVRIIHGKKDDIVPIAQSERFVSKNTNSTMLAVDSDHGLLNVTKLMWQEFCHLADLSGGAGV